MCASSSHPRTLSDSLNPLLKVFSNTESLKLHFGDKKHVQGGHYLGAILALLV